MREIIVDNFAGGGGASTGIEMAIGRSVDIAINHDPAAIAMHKANHPDSEHYCESVWDVDPVKACKGRRVALAWFSPDCKHFSKAKGGKPVEKSIRGLAWIVLKWAGKVRPRVIMLENVEEFVTWGPIRKGKPIKSKKGQTFQQWKSQLESLGYKVEHRELRACDYGAPTIRKRFFLVARCDGKPIIWPKPTHGDPESLEVRCGMLKPWRTAAEIIDWSLPCPSIFERKKPLADNTLRRIAKGIQKFVIENPEPFIVQVNYSGAKHHYCNPIEKPLSTITSKHGFGLVTPVISQIGQTGGGDRLHDINDPLSTIVSKQEHLLVTPFLTQYHSYDDNARGQALENPILTIDTSNRYGLVSAFITKFYKTGIGQDVRDPLHTITTSIGHFGEVRAFLLKYYGNGEGQKINEPLGTITTKDRFGLVTIQGQDYQIVDIGMRMLEPRELFNGNGFPGDYIIDRDADGKSYPKSDQVAKCGNAVCPPMAEALVRANLPEYCLSEMSEAL
jgi:DNA (cytosine-5)-methyltransferase 1